MGIEISGDRCQISQSWPIPNHQFPKVEHPETLLALNCTTDGGSAEEGFFYFTDCSLLLVPLALVGIFCFNSMIPSSGYCYSGAGFLTFLGPASHNLGWALFATSLSLQVVTPCSVTSTSFPFLLHLDLFFPWCCFYCSPTVSSQIVSETVYTGREDTPLHP